MTTPLLFADATLGVLQAPAAQAPRPNIVLMVADDLGYGDVGVFRDGHEWQAVKPALDGVGTDGRSYF